MSHERENNWWEKLLIYLFVSLFTLLLIINIAKIYELSHTDVMGIGSNGITRQIPITQRSSITLQLEDDLLYPGIEIYINGEHIGYFGYTKLLLLEVSDGDVVAVNASMYQEPINITLTSTSDNINSSIKNKRIKAENLTIIALIKVT